MKNSSFNFIILLIAITSFAACKRDVLDIDTKNVKMDLIQMKRLDKDVFSLNSVNIAEKTKAYNFKYGIFYNRYISSIINTGGVKDSLYSTSLLKFINDKDIKSAYSELKNIYTDNDVELLGEDLTEAVKRFTVFFPERKTPKQYVTFMSGFNYNVVYADSTLAVGLDMYLGSDNLFYKMLQYPNFQTHGMSKSYVLSDMVKGWMITEFDNSDAVNTLLNHMIFYGKIFYLADALLPQTTDSIKFNYTTKQVAYCKQYENKLWGFFAKDNKLFDNDMKLVSEYTGDGPFTRSISKECPPRVIMWIGRQVVASYMKNNKEATLESLMNEKDAQKILSKSKYKP